MENLVTNIVEAFATGGIGLAIGSGEVDDVRRTSVELCCLSNAKTRQYTTYLAPMSVNPLKLTDFSFYAVSLHQPVALDTKLVIGTFNDNADEFWPAYPYRKAQINVDGVIEQPHTSLETLRSAMGNSFRVIYYEENPL
jgi:hypothetical protein